MLLKYPTTCLRIPLFFFCFIFNCFRDFFQQNITIFKSLNKFHYVIHFFLFEIIKVVVLFWIPASIAEAAAVVPNRAKTFFAKGIATFINGPANLLKNDPKNPPNWITLEIWTLESVKSVEILLLNAFLGSIFFPCLQFLVHLII